MKNFCFINHVRVRTGVLAAVSKKKTSIIAKFDIWQLSLTTDAAIKTNA